MDSNKYIFTFQSSVIKNILILLLIIVNILLLWDAIAKSNKNTTVSFSTFNHDDNGASGNYDTSTNTVFYNTEDRRLRSVLVNETNDISFISTRYDKDRQLNHITDPMNWYRNNPLGIPPGESIALPSIRVNDSMVDTKRKIYGGIGDKTHLGGFTEIDIQGISPSTWKYMISSLGVHSILDVGCGRGISTSWFHFHGCNVLCIEGSHDAIERNIMPNITEQVIEHDYSRGPYWPRNTYDAVWAVEFLEHVGVQFHFNYITTFRKAALIFVTSSKWGGWHHVEIHNDTWWIRKFTSYGFQYSEALTTKLRGIAMNETNTKNQTLFNGKRSNPQHIRSTLKVFINPIVASLPEHAHLFPQHGCYHSRGGPTGIINRICGTGKDGELETPLPNHYWPIELTSEMDIKWNAYMNQTIKEN